MPWLLNVIYGLLIVAASPVLLVRALRQGKYRAGWREKLLGSVPDLERTDERLWLHAVSVGEVLLLKGLIAELRAGNPHRSIVLTTTTATGHDVAVRQYPDLTVCYCPLDFSWAVRRAVARLKPTALVLAELELWPNLISIASHSGVRLAIVNGRLSEKSFRGYRKLRPFLRRLLARFDVIAVQNETYASRFLTLGARQDRLAVTGSVKFDGVDTERGNPLTDELRRAFGIERDDLVFIAGSTQHPEEQLALETWQTLQQAYPKLRLILVPRHKERFEEVARLVERNDLPLVRRSITSPDVPPQAARRPFPSRPVLLLDTLGELGACWGLADIAFVGGSLTNRGGQNMIEPAACGAAVLFGPNTWNFRDVVTLLLSTQAARVVSDGLSLTATVRELLIDSAARREMGHRAKETVSRHRGATRRTAELLEETVLRPLDRPAGRRAA